MNLNQNTQIVTAFEELKLSPQEIAEQFEFSLTSVKAILMQSSLVYRKTMKQDSKLDFNDTELQDANETIINLMRYSEDEHLRARLARYVRDDKKGRLDIGSNLANKGMNVVVFNQYLNQAKEALKESDKPIEIEASTESSALASNL